MYVYVYINNYNNTLIYLFFYNIDLQQDIKDNFFGQHIASKLILSALKGNDNHSIHIKKPLVMSFHGWSGSGKNYITEIIANHMFKSENIKRLRYHVITRLSKITTRTDYTKVFFLIYYILF